MALLATQQINATGGGLSPTFVAATVGGDTMPVGDRTYLLVKNASGGSITVTLVTPGTVSGLAIADPTYTVAATTGFQFIGPVTAALFDPGTGVASITYSGVTSLTVAAVTG